MPAQPVAFGPEFRINSTTSGAQESPSIALLADGDFVVVWESSDQDGSGYGVYGRVFNADGSAETGEILLANLADGDQRCPVVTGLDDGGFAVAWQSGGIDMSYDNHAEAWDIALRIFGEDGAALGDQIAANTTVADNQRTPSITTLADGSILAGWTGWLPVWNSYWGYWSREWRATGQHFTDTGEVIGGEVETVGNTYGIYDAFVLGLAGGNYVMLWDGQDVDETYGLGIYGQMFAADGTATTGRFHVNNGAWNNQIQVTGAALPGGGFVAVWVNVPDWPNGVCGRIYDGAGTPLGDQFWISPVNIAHSSPSVTVLGDGGFVVVWGQQGGDADRHGIVGQRFAADGTQVGAAFTVNSATAGDQVAPVVTALDDGGFVVSWQSDGHDGDGAGVYAQVFAPQRFGTSASETLVDYRGVDWLGGLAGDDTLIGRDGNDTLSGDSGADLVRGDTGNDRIWLGDGDDTGFGGGGSERMHGDAGNDSLSGDTGNDTLWGDDGADSLSGGLGRDNLQGGADDDTMSGDGGNDSLTGGGGHDSLHGNADNDLLIGGFGRDTLLGDEGSDSLLGRDGADVLRGGVGADTLVGGTGADILSGGSEADRFVFALGDSLLDPGSRDRLTDVEAGLDRIDLTGVAEGLSFIGNALFSGGGLEVRYTAAGLLLADIDGDRAADFGVLVVGAPSLDGILIL